MENVRRKMEDVNHNEGIERQTPLSREPVPNLFREAGLCHEKNDL